MKIVVGLGNPGKEYENTKHNLGFMFLDYINKKYLNGNFKTFKNNKILEGSIGEKKIVLAKPQTYMNLSGDAVINLKNWYKVDNEDILVIYDDFDIPFESIRYRESGSAGTHNGMKDIINKLSSKDIPRLRIGTGGLKKEKQEIISFVLSKFSRNELEALDEIFEKAYAKLKDFLDK